MMLVTEGPGMPEESLAVQVGDMVRFRYGDEVGSSIHCGLSCAWPVAAATLRPGSGGRWTWILVTTSFLLLLGKNWH